MSVCLCMWLCVVEGMLVEQDVCIGKLTPASVSALQVLLKLPTSSGSSATGNGAGSPRNPAADPPDESEEEQEKQEESPTGTAESAADTVLNSYLFDKVATITRARLKS